MEGVAGAEGSGFGARWGVGLVLAADAGEELVQVVSDLSCVMALYSRVGD